MFRPVEDSGCDVDGARRQRRPSLVGNIVKQRHPYSRASRIVRIRVLRRVQTSSSNQKARLSGGSEFLESGLACLRSRATSRRRFCSGWFAKRLYRDGLITHIEDLQLLGAPAREGRRDPRLRISSSRAQRRHRADLVAIQINFVEADDAHHSFRSCGVLVANGRSEEHMRRRPPISRGFRFHHFRLD